jgi:hypothetical protein
VIEEIIEAMRKAAGTSTVLQMCRPGRNLIMSGVTRSVIRCEQLFRLSKKQDTR